MDEPSNLASAEARAVERLDPAERRAHQAAQHWARYEWASSFLPARRVLDCACGLGYGSALLRERGAAAVVGVDIAREAITEASRRYPREGVEYLCHDALTLTPAAVGRFDLIVSLETIEHVEEPRRLLEVLAALLEPDGTFVMSCPNDRVLNVNNPYHKWRADRSLLTAWLQELFPYVSAYVEVHTVGTAIWPAEVAQAAVISGPLVDVATRQVNGLSVESAPGFLYVCARRPRTKVRPVAATLLDGFAYVLELEHAKEELYREAQRMAAAWEAQTARVHELEHAKEELYREAQRMAAAWEAQTARVHELEQVRDQIWQELQTTIAAGRRLHEACERDAAKLREAEHKCQELDARLAALQAAFDALKYEHDRWQLAISEFKQQRLYRILRKLELLRDLAPPSRKPRGPCGDGPPSAGPSNRAGGHG